MNPISTLFPTKKAAAERAMQQAQSIKNRLSNDERLKLINDELRSGKSLTQSNFIPLKTRMKLINKKFK